MPQLEQVHTYASQIFWLALTFIPLFFVLWKVALPKVDDVLAARQIRIENDLDKARRLKDDAEAVLAAYEAVLAEARGRARAVLAETSRELAEAAAAEQARIGDRLAGESAAAEARIAEARDAAVGNIRAAAVEVAQAAAKQIAGKAATGLKAKVIEGAVDAAVKG
jgi:F-type H+-transporting ATPase subunit b